MKIAMASDHALLSEERSRDQEGSGHEIEDFGAYSGTRLTSRTRCAAALAVSEGRAERGIFVDGVGYAAR